MTEIIKKLKKIPAEKVKKEFISLMEGYFTPAFGSISKRDFDITLFMKLQKLGVVSDGCDLYELVSAFKITRSKARNLIYESKLRSTDEEGLKKELRKIITESPILKDTDKVCMEISNPLLIDYLKSELKDMHFISDGSFSPELVRLSIDAYTALFERLLGSEYTEKAKNTLIEAGAKPDTTFGGVVKGMMSTFVANKLGNEAADVFKNITNKQYLKDIFKKTAK